MNRERIDLSEITFVKLDEWYGVEPQAACTCTTFIREHLLDQLYMQPKAVVEFVSDAADIRQELDRMDVFLSEHPIDVMILGLGMNGHLGLNEPADFLTLNAHYAELDEKTKTHDMVKGYEPKGGLTIGLQGIFTSGRLLCWFADIERKQIHIGSIFLQQFFLYSIQFLHITAIEYKPVTVHGKFTRAAFPYSRGGSGDE